MNLFGNEWFLLMCLILEWYVVTTFTKNKAVKTLVYIPSLQFVLTNLAQNVEIDLTNVADNMGNMRLKNQKFVGSWELLEWTMESTDGRVASPFGEDAVGQITYDSNGNISVQIMKINRPQFLSEDPLQGRPEEIIDAFNGFIAYSGNYEVIPNSDQVIHQIKISSFPNWVGQNQIRNFEFNEDKLTLSTDYIGLSKHKLVWRKIAF